MGVPFLAAAMPERVSSADDSRSRSSIYGGWFDPANVLASWASTTVSLKFASLFYRQIVVPDSFFHCYGPLFSELVNEANRAGGKTPDAGQNDRFPIIGSLREGVIVPALRAGPSILETWRSGSDGVTPGEFLVVRRDHGDGVLGLLDDVARYYRDWPDSLGPSPPNKPSRFASAVRDLFLDERSPYRVVNWDVPPDLPWSVAKQLSEAISLLEGLASVFEDAGGNPTFRRGDVEEYLGRQLGIRLSSYEDVTKRVDWSDPYRTLTASYAYYVLSVATSAYELMQAAEFEAVAGMFPLHDDPLIEERGLHRALREFSPGLQPPRKAPLVFGSFDVSRLSMQHIFDFRRTERFERYLELLEETVAPEEGECFWEVNYDFVEYVRRIYVPSIIESFPHAGRITSVAQAASSALVAVAAGTALVGGALEIAGLPLFRILAGGGGLLGVTAWAPRIRDYIRAKREIRSFRKNNYAFWCSTDR